MIDGGAASPSGGGKPLGAGPPGPPVEGTTVSAFRNVLVGVDLTRSNPDGPALDAVAEEVVKAALWLAEAGGSPLTFLSVLPARAGGPEQGGRQADTPEQVILSGLVRRAGEKGIESRAALAYGQGWAEIVRQVQDGGHDLLVIGTHGPHGFRRLLLGSTAVKLLHECPCPVWVCKPGHAVPREVVIASDLSPHSEEAVRLGLLLARLGGARARLVYAADYPLDRHWVDSPGSATTRRYHGAVQADAGQALHEQARRNGHDGRDSVSFHVVDGDGTPDHAILKFVGEHRPDLLVLGTVARHGLWGLLVGNASERLLPEVPCSLLAARPRGRHDGADS